MELTSLVPGAQARARGAARIDLLGKGSLWTHRLRGGPVLLSCTAGAVWITREGAPDDVVLEAGSSYGGEGRGLLVVEALEPAQLEVASDRGGRAARAFLDALLDRARALLERARGSWLVLLSLAALYLVWGSTYLAVSVALETLPPFLLAGVRFVTAGALLYGALRLRGAPRPTLRQWGAAARVGGLLLVAGNGLVVVAQQWVSSGVAAVVVSTMPLWLALFTTLRAARGGAAGPRGAPEVSRGEWVGLLVGFAGAALLHLGGDLRAEHAGALLIVLAPVAWALGSLYSRTTPLPEGPMAVAAEMLAAGAVMLGISALAGERLAEAPSSRSLLALAYLVVFGSIVGLSAYTYLLRNTRPAIATSYAYVNPIIAVALGILLGGESASAATWVAAAVIGAGVLIVSRARR
ncbi:drug/metabolite exporter YedA [Sorangium sp. So ce1097]|uniref:drug/metabolite exporter YedA n=1 Tax=Sorangium sp. So ce1097 TaxID=3133330 RepID=UPI003F5E81C5